MWLQYQFSNTPGQASDTFSATSILMKYWRAELLSDAPFISANGLSCNYRSRTACWNMALATTPPAQWPAWQLSFRHPQGHRHRPLLARTQAASAGTLQAANRSHRPQHHASARLSLDARGTNQCLTIQEIPPASPTAPQLAGYIWVAVPE